MVLALMWMVLAFDQVYQLDLARFGILPRTMIGLPGIVFSPLIHGSVGHLLGNSFPLLILGWFTVYFYPKAIGRVVLVSWFASGLWVWAMGRESHHIGASGMVYSLAGFLFFSGLFRRRAALMAVSLIVVFLYGSKWWGVLPIQPGVSWESHFFGGLMGTLMAWWYRKVPPAHVPPPRVYPDDEELDGEAAACIGQNLGNMPPSPTAPQGPELMDGPARSSTWPGNKEQVE
jgi:membrane associated rhomboid family serine protease